MPVTMSLAKRMAQFLNECLAIDRNAISWLFLTRVLCNDKLVEHPTVQVRYYTLTDDYRLSPLGLLNGFLGVVDATQEGALRVVLDQETGMILEFFVSTEPMMEETTPADTGEEEEPLIS